MNINIDTNHTNTIMYVFMYSKTHNNYLTDL